MSYCPVTNTRFHASGCFTTGLICPKTEHTHDPVAGGSCWTKDAILKCRFASEHTHSSGKPCHDKIGPSCGGD